MNFLIFNLLMALIWMFLTGEFGFGGLVMGFLVGFLALWLVRRFTGSRRYVRAVFGSVRLLAVYFVRLISANFQLARDVLRRKLIFRPRFLLFGAEDLSQLQTVLLANMIALTPGTVVVDLDDAGNTLYIHSLYAQSAEKERQTFRLFTDLIRGAAGKKGRKRNDGR